MVDMMDMMYFQFGLSNFLRIFGKQFILKCLQAAETEHIININTYILDISQMFKI